MWREWRENKQAEVLKNWQEMTRQAREAGVPKELLQRYIREIYGEVHHD